jgi:hypothetical protein
MTAIVALIDEGKVFMGGDAAIVTRGWGCSTITTPKIFKKGKALIGVSGMLRTNQIIKQSDLDFPDAFQEDPDMLLSYLIDDVVPLLRKLLSENGLLIKNEDDNDSMKSNILIGLCGRLFTVTSDFAIQETLYKFEAIGGGDEVAMGSLFSTEGTGKHPANRILLALRAAQAFHADVREPFTILESE